ncbi:hypothetical protein KEM56_003633 [Ascosphaera pollenicola]|nr:hypothetical protein KEM56_003633 [Ascosphaera pollenicola]
MAFKSSVRPKSSRQSISRFLAREGYTEVQSPSHDMSGDGPRRSWKVPTYAVLMVAQAAATLALEGYVFGRYTNDLNPQEGSEQETMLKRYKKTIPTFLTLYIFGFVYELLLVADALRHKNIIQLYGLCICNIGLLIYGAVQIEQIQKAVEVLQAKDEIREGTWSEINGCLIAIPCVIGAFTICETWITWRLSSEFLDHHFTTTGNSNRKRRGLTAYQALFLGGLAYFIFKMVRMYYGPKKQDYDSARKSLTFFAAITILLIILTICNACVCYNNFGNNLTEILGFFGPKRVKEGDTEMGIHEMSQHENQRPIIE